jgi:hypothetical protein
MSHPIGRGSYGQGWLARNRLGTWRAVKVVSREAFEDRKPFEREFKGIQRFEPVSRSHEGLVDVLQVGGAEDYFYYVMELADDASERSDGVKESWSDGKPGGPEPPVHHCHYSTTPLGTLPARSASNSSGWAACQSRNACGLDGCWPRRSPICTGTTSSTATSNRRTLS